MIDLWTPRAPLMAVLFLCFSCLLGGYQIGWLVRGRSPNVDPYAGKDGTWVGDAYWPSPVPACGLPGTPPCAVEFYAPKGDLAVTFDAPVVTHDDSQNVNSGLMKDKSGAIFLVCSGRIMGAWKGAWPITADELRSLDPCWPRL